MLDFYYYIQLSFELGHFSTFKFVEFLVRKVGSFVTTVA